MGQVLSKLFSYFRYNQSAFEGLLRQHKAECIEMGYTEKDIKQAIHELLNHGLEKPSLEDIIDMMEKIGEAIKENRRLKSIVYCMVCHKNIVSALFLPCTHNELCITCAESLDKCPVCESGIQEKVRTYMV